MDRHLDAARLLLSARRDPTQLLLSLPESLRPKDAAGAYHVQRAVMAELGPIGGWKVGSPRPDGPCTCAPMPASGVVASGATVSDAPLRGVEAEIAVRMGSDLPPRSTPYTREEVLAAIASVHPAIEVLQSRYADSEAVDPLSSLSDSLSHGGFVYGEAVPDWQAVDLATETVRLVIDGAEVKRRTANPAGDMIRLVTWLANEGAAWAGGLKAGQFVTTGSWTGKDFTGPGGTVRVAFAHMGEVELRFA